MTTISSQYSSAESSSRPTLTRESTAWGSDLTSMPRTPTDDPYVSTQNRYSANSKDMSGIQGVMQEQENKDYIYSDNSPNMHSSKVPGSSFLAQIKQDVKGATSSRYRSSAKELITRYESLSPATFHSPCTTPQSTFSRHDLSPPDPLLNKTFSAMKDRKISPLKESFRNLMQLFGKRRNGKDDEASVSSFSSPYDPSTPTLSVHPIPNSQCSPIPPETLHSGPILYLSRPSTSGSTLPVWTNCKASLTHDRLVLEWLTAFGNPSTSTIMLEKTADVHSLSNTQVDPMEKSLLPQSYKNAHIFEISFPGGPPERFATMTVSERSTWVSCIWDALLQMGASKGESTQGPSNLSESIRQRSPLPPIPVLVDSHYRSETILSRTGHNQENVGSSFRSSPLPEITDKPIGSMLHNSYSPALQHISELGKESIEQVSAFSKNQGTLLNRAPTYLSRCSSVGSSYSAAQSQIGTPNLTKKERHNTTGGVKNSIYNKPSIATRTNYEDEQVIYDFYTDKRHYGHTLSPIADVSDSGETPKTENSPVMSERRTIFSNRKNSQKTSISGYASCKEEADNKINVLQPNDGKPARQASQRSTISCNSNLSNIVREDDEIHPIVSIIQDNATKHYHQTGEIKDQITALHSDVLGLSAYLRTAMEDQRLEVDSSLKAVLGQFCGRIEKAASSHIVDESELRELFLKLDTLTKQLKDSDVGGLLVKRPKEDLSDPVSSLCKESSYKELNHLNLKLDEVLSILKGSCVTQELHNIGTNKDKTDEKLEKNTANEGSNTKTVTDPEGVTSVNAVHIESKLLEVLDLLKTIGESKNLQAVQQTENARYLHELNSWLETFVNTGTTQLQSVVKGVEELRRELGIISEEGVAPSGIKAELLNLTSGVKAGEGKIEALQIQFTEIAEKLKEQCTTNKAVDLQTVVGMIEAQKKEQESMLRGIANGLSNDIRGERLRFVEAMKEATAINVQVHVEEFKKELSREVMMMTCEVSRLQRERQNLEQQIADLFAFFAKQRAEMEQQQAERARQLQLPTQGGQHRPTQRSRPLPVPH